MSFHIFHRHSIYLVDLVDLTCSLYSWWEGFGSSSLATLPLGFNCGFISTSARCGGSAAAWVSGVLAAPDTQGSWRLGQKEIECSRRVWQPVLANMLQYSCLENTPDREAWQATVYRVTKSWTQPKRPQMHRCKTFFFSCGSSAPVRVECDGGTHAWVTGSKCSGTWTVSATGVMALTVFFRASGSWRSEGLFG